MRTATLVLTASLFASTPFADNTASVSFQTGNEAYAKGEHRKALGLSS